jgi:UDP-N-acetylmuramate dehydrogenase
LFTFVVDDENTMSMPVIKKNVSLKPYNTFGIDVSVSYFVKANTLEKIFYAINFASYNQLPISIIGGGSNVLLTKDINGVVVNPFIQGLILTEETNSDAVVRVGAGMPWDSLVSLAVDHGWGGLENLSKIPGSVGAAPIQNIGAYGVEAKDTIIKVEAIDIKTRKPIELSSSECRFGYRDSIFKQELRGKVVVTYVWFKLTKKPEYQLAYGNLKEEVAKLGEVSLKNIRQTVINIRSNKLPDPATIGNAGSFFKNPVVDVALLQKIQQDYPDVPHFSVSETQVKIPAGWLIEQCGWKGKRLGSCGVHDRQALVLVNYGGATGEEILTLARSIQQSVYERFNINLDMEVNVF